MKNHWQRGLTTYCKPNPLLSKTAVITFMEIHPVLTKYPRSVQGKLCGVLERCRKLLPLLSETTVTTYGKTSNVY